MNFVYAKRPALRQTWNCRQNEKINLSCPNGGRQKTFYSRRVSLYLVIFFSFSDFLLRFSVLSFSQRVGPLLLLPLWKWWLPCFCTLFKWFYGHSLKFQPCVPVHCRSFLCQNSRDVVHDRLWFSVIGVDRPLVQDSGWDECRRILPGHFICQISWGEIFFLFMPLSVVSVHWSSSRKGERPKRST